MQLLRGFAWGWEGDRSPVGLGLPLLFCLWPVTRDRHKSVWLLLTSTRKTVSLGMKSLPSQVLILQELGVITISIIAWGAGAAVQSCA